MSSAVQPGADAASGGVTSLLDRASRVLNEGLAWTAAALLGAMMLFSVADMVMRGFGVTIAGSYEVIGWLSAVAMALALGTVQRHKGHVAMELVVVKLGRRSRALVEALMALISLALFAVVAFYVVRYGRVLHETGSLSETLRVIVYPWVYVVGLGCAGLTLALLVDCLRSLATLFATLRG
ncbi:MAG: TRAP transporter small permease subunit [Betaproteobacteria bacterium]|nr:TRAP transporter small permease subunit [Betaproteobacteria bacterium]